MKEQEYGIVDKSQLIKAIEDLRSIIREERELNKTLQDLYERQLSIQDREIQRLNEELTLLKIKFNERGDAQ